MKRRAVSGRGLPRVVPRRGLPRVVAIATGLWLLLCGVLGARHEATCAHVVDARTGARRHTDRLVGRHTSPLSDVHGAVDPDTDLDACAIAAASHQAARPEVAGAAPAALHMAACPAIVGCTPAAREASAVYHLAPKTSPPGARV